MLDAPSYVAGYMQGKAAGGGGGGDITVESLSVTENGTTTAPAGTAFNPVVVDVPNTYTAGDEGKVVSNGALVAQTSDTVTQNGTVNTTLNNSVVVNVPTGAMVLGTGTFTGNGSNKLTVPVGKKMASSDFMFYCYVPNETEFPFYSNISDFVFMEINAPKEIVYFDLSSDGTKGGQATITAKVVQSDQTIVNKTVAGPVGGGRTIRNGGVPANPNYLQPGNMKIIKDTTGFSVNITTTGNDVQTLSGITYNWKLLYYGNDAAHDIVEVA